MVRARWLTAARFTALWGSLTFPLVAYAGALMALRWDWAGLVVLIAAIGLVPAIAVQILKMWATGTLAQRTNAAEA